MSGLESKKQTIGNDAEPKGAALPDRAVKVEKGFRLSSDSAGRRLDKIMAAKFPAFSRAYWQQVIRAGKVTLDGRTVRPSTRVQGEQTVTYTVELHGEPAINPAIDLIYSDQSLLVIYKPPDLPVHPAGAYHYNTLLHIVRHKGMSDPIWPQTIRFAGRLDRETSGIMVLARTTEAMRILQAGDRLRPVPALFCKGYLAVVEGEFPAQVDATGYIEPAPGRIVRKQRAFTADGRARAELSQGRAVGRGGQQLVHEQGTANAFTDSNEEHGAEPAGEGRLPCRTLLRRVLSHNGLSLVAARLITGRAHQIRATLCSMGYPMVGDRLYGLDSRYFLDFIEGRESALTKERLRIPRTALHCAVVGLEHPVSAKEFWFSQRLPADMANLFPSMNNSTNHWRDYFKDWFRSGCAH